MKVRATHAEAIYVATQPCRGDLRSNGPKSNEQATYTTIVHPGIDKSPGPPASKREVIYGSWLKV